MHSPGYATAREMRVSLVGPNAQINASSGLEEQMDALLGSRDLAKIETIYEWISGKKPYLYRFTQKPARDEEQAAVLCCYDGRFGIGCYYVGSGGPSRGVVASAMEK